MSGGESDARKSKLTELDAEVLEMLGLDQLASDDEDEEVEVDAHYPKPLPVGMVDDGDYAEAPAFRVSWADMLEEDSYDGELERLHDQDWTKATTASLRAAEGSRLTEKQERKMQSSKSGGEHTSQGMTELMPKQAAGHRPGVLTGNGAGDGSGGGPGAGEGLSRSARRRQRRKAKTHKPR